MNVAIIVSCQKLATEQGCFKKFRQYILSCEKTSPLKILIEFILLVFYHSNLLFHSKASVLKMKLKILSSGPLQGFRIHSTWNLRLKAKLLSRWNRWPLILDFKYKIYSDPRMYTLSTCEGPVERFFNFI